MAKSIEISTQAEVIKVWVDEVPVSIHGGKGSIPRDAGSHSLTWEVRGAPGTSYSIEITSPDESKVKRGDTFDGAGFDAGDAPFQVDAAATGGQS